MFDRTESFTVRPATVDNISVLAHHRAALFHDMGTLPEHQMEPLERATASYLRDAMPRGEYLAWVAEARDTQRLIVGGAGVQLRSILPRPVPAVTISNSDPFAFGIALARFVYIESYWRPF